MAAAEGALQAGRIVDADRLYANWRRSRSTRTETEEIRAHLLAANLDLLADRPRAAARHIGALRGSVAAPQLAALQAGHLLLIGKPDDALSVLGHALDEIDPAENLSLRSALLRERGAARLEARDGGGGQADLAEAERISLIAGDGAAAAAARLEMADSLLALGETVAAVRTLPPLKTLKGDLRIRAGTIRLRCRLASGERPKRPSDYGTPDTLAEAERLVAYAEAAAAEDDGDACRRALSALEEGDWLKCVARLGCEATLLGVSLALEEGRFDEALLTLERLRVGLSPGLWDRFSAAAGLLRMRCELSLGRGAEALATGRGLLREIEKKRAGLYALSHLRSLSGGSRELYATIIGLELRHGSPASAFEALQQFSSRALLRRSGLHPAERLERALGGSDSPKPPHSEHPGRWALRRILRRLGARSEETLSWRRVIEVLEGLAEQDEH